MQYVSAKLSIQTHLQTLWRAVGISHAVRIERVDTGTQHKNLQYGTVNALFVHLLCYKNENSQPVSKIPFAGKQKSFL